MSMLFGTNIPDEGMPIGLGMELSKNLNALNVFASMDRETQGRIIDRARLVRTRAEMQALVTNLNPDFF